MTIAATTNTRFYRRSLQTVIIDTTATIIVTTVTVATTKLLHTFTCIHEKNLMIQAHATYTLKPPIRHKTFAVTLQQHWNLAYYNAAFQKTLKNSYVT